MSDHQALTSNTRTSRPLKGKTVLVTRPRNRAVEVVRLLEESGAKVILFPTIEIAPPEDWRACDEAIENLATFDGVVFTSANAVSFFLDRLNTKFPRSFESLKRIELYAVGEKTSRTLKQHGLIPVHFSEVSDSKTLASALAERGVDGKRFLFPKGNIAGEELPTLLGADGASVDEIVVYATHQPFGSGAEEVRKLLSESGIDVITFFSPSSVESFVQMIPISQVVSCSIAVIGKTTAEAARKVSLQVDILAAQPTAADLVASILKFYEQQNR